MDTSILCLECRDTGVNDTGKTCQECCEHNEQDHYICLDCDYEGEPSDWYDEDYGQDR